MMNADDPADAAARHESQRHTARATSIIGGAAMGSILFGLIRMKIAAIILGPVGIGTIGLLQNLLNTAASIGGLNLGVAGARQIVASGDLDSPAGAAAKRAVILTALSLAIVSGLTFWLFRTSLAVLLFEDATRGGQIGWLAIGVAATAAAGYQMAILSSARRIGDIARLNLLTAAMAGLVGSVCIVVWKSGGIIPFILAMPVASLAFGWILTRRSAVISAPRARAAETRSHVSGLLKLGLALTVSIFVSLCGQLTIRTLIERKLGAVALGHFQAAWTLTTVYLAFIFQTMASDYLPRLTASVSDRNATQRLVENQAEVGILLAAPILLAMIGGAPWVLSILYTSKFAEATELLRYQMLGDLIRLATWPVALVLLSAGASRTYAIADVSGTAILVAMTFVLLPMLGLAAPGVAYLIMNIMFGVIIMLIVHQRFFVVLGARAFRMFVLLATSCGITFALGLDYTLLGAGAGGLGAALWAAVAYRRLALSGFQPSEAMAVTGNSAADARTLP